MKRSYALIIAAVMLAAALFIIGCPPRDGADSSAAPVAIPDVAGPSQPVADATQATTAEPAPSLEFTDINGRKLSLQAQSGNAVVLYFWATFCSPCLAKMPKIDAISEAYGDKGVVVWALSLDPNQAMVDGWLQQNDLSIPIALVGDDVTEALFPGEKPLPIPRTIVIDQAGQIVAKMDPDATVEEVEEVVKSLVE